MLAWLKYLRPRWKRLTAETVAIGVLIALLCFMGQKLVGMQGMMTNDHQPLFGDFIAFWSAGKLVLAGKIALVHNPSVVHALQAQTIPHLPVVAPWNSPPQFLLIAIILGLMPYPVAALAFLASSATIYFVAARKLLPDTRALIFAATMPAAVYEIGSVQTGIVIAGITGLALFWQDKRPLTAGALLGILTIKPHMAILWPIYLALTGRWKMFGAAAASVIIITLAAGFAFGFDTYTRFLANLEYTQNLISHRHVSAATYASLYGNLLGLNVAHAYAIAAHAFSALLALSLTIFIWRRGGDARIQGAAFCAMTMLASPYLFFYDTTLLGVGAALLGAPRKFWEWPALVLGWASGLSVAIGFYYHVPLAPVAAWTILITAAARALAEERPMKTDPVPARSEQSSAPATA